MVLFYVDVVPPRGSGSRELLHGVCEEEIDVSPCTGPGGIQYNSNIKTVTSARDFARRVRPEVITGYEVRRQEVDPSPVDEDRRYLSDIIDLVSVDEDLYLPMRSVLWIITLMSRPGMP